MKTFNIVKQDVVLWGKYHLPINSVYGCITCEYKKRVGVKTVYTKRGRMVEKPIFSLVQEEIIYYVDNFKPIIFANGRSIRLHVYDKTRDKWVNTHSLAHPKFKQLHDFLIRMFEKTGITDTRTCKYLIDSRCGMPREKKAQCTSDNVFRASVGYALSKNVMTTHNVARDGWALYETYGNNSAHCF